MRSADCARTRLGSGMTKHEPSGSLVGGKRLIFGIWLVEVTPCPRIGEPAPSFHGVFGGAPVVSAMPNADRRCHRPCNHTPVTPVSRRCEMCSPLIHASV